MLDKRIGLWTAAAVCGIALRALAADAPPAYANHYVMQLVVRGGSITLMREFGSPVRTTAAAAR